MDYGLQAVHAELYDVLADAVRVLEENGLPYSMICGSLLGAVRHQGMIPWDDDIDIVLPRESYDRFEELYPSQCGLGFSLDLSDTWVPRVRKVGGDAFVDLFVLGPLPDKRLPRFWKLLRLRVLQGMLKEHTDYRRFSFKGRVLLWGTHLLGLPFGKESKLRAYRRVARSGGDSAQLHMSDGAFNLLNMAFARDAFTDLTHVPFGYLSVRVPRDPKPVLTQLYGPDYMTPPPENKRKPLHLDR
ncbi:MAG TPA: LicD family protein [Candidatus Limiplasma sp.]|nr:LicD family protein [Candidatus Limiplasma sp.]